MTIFLALVKEAVKIKITQYIEQSTVADYSATNLIANSAGLGRDTELARQKREVAGELNAAVSALAGVDDDEILPSLKSLISKNETITHDLRKEKGYVDGSFEKVVEELNGLIESLEDRLKTLELWSVEKSEDPYHVFCFHLGHYFLLKAVDSYENSYLAVASRDPRVNTYYSISEAKDKLVYDAVYRCRDSISALDKDHSEYNRHKARVVTDEIEKLKQQNITLCRSKSGLFVGPSLGRLGGCLDDALAVLQHEEASHGLADVGSLS
jgi:hypothetical protein